MNHEKLKRYRADLTEFAIESGVTHFCTLKPGLRGATRYDVEHELRPIVGALVKEFGRLRSSLPRRAPVGIEDLPFIIGFPERFDRFRNLDPHFHCLIRLDERATYDEVALFRGLARLRWGEDKSPEAGLQKAIYPARSSRFDFGYLAFEEVPVDAPHSKRIIKDRRFRPTFDLKEINNHAGIVSYITKQHHDLEFWSHLELLDRARYPSNPKNLSAKIY